MISIALVLVPVYHLRQWHPTQLLLTGVAVASLWSAVISLVLTVLPDARLQGALFWMMGGIDETADASWLLLAVTITVLLTWPHRIGLDLLAQGETLAVTLGVPVRLLQWMSYLLASLLTALAVITAGGIGFVGLVTPHILRQLGWRNHGALLPACVLAGAALLTGADLLARTLTAPQQLPLGAMTALIGAPFFIALLYRSYRLPTGETG
jgi:iron complex transport system permease protein